MSLQRNHSNNSKQMYQVVTLFLKLSRLVCLGLGLHPLLKVNKSKKWEMLRMIKITALLKNGIWSLVCVKLYWRKWVDVLKI